MQLVEENQKRGRGEPEFELLDTGVFHENRYFDVFIEYAKSDWEDILVRITRVQPRARGGGASCTADAVVSKHLVVGEGSTAAGGAEGRGS